jgi:hypothetical protein
VVEVDLSDPAGQVMRVLAAIGDYQELVDRNYDALMELGTWDARIPDLMDACRQAVMSCE